MNLGNSLSKLQAAGFRGVFTSVVNIESGQASISTQRVYQCQLCTDLRTPTSNCAECGRTDANAFRLRSGSGDCLASIIEICNLDNFAEVKGIVIYFDSDITAQLCDLMDAEESEPIWNLSNFSSENQTVLQVQNIIAEPLRFELMQEFIPDIRCMDCELEVPPYAFMYLPEDGMCECGKELNLDLTHQTFGKCGLFVSDANRTLATSYVSSDSSVSEGTYNLFVSLDRKVALVLQEQVSSLLDISSDNLISSGSLTSSVLGEESDLVETSLESLTRPALLANLLINDRDESAAENDELTEYGFMGAYLLKRAHNLEKAYFQLRDHCELLDQELEIDLTNLISITDKDGESPWDEWENREKPEMQLAKKTASQAYYLQNRNLWARQSGYEV